MHATYLRVMSPFLEKLIYQGVVIPAALTSRGDNEILGIRKDGE